MVLLPGYRRQLAGSAKAAAGCTQSKEGFAFVPGILFSVHDYLKHAMHLNY